MREYLKPLPMLDDDILPFWEAVKQHKLVIQRCKTCGAAYFAASYCTECDDGLNTAWAENMAWVEASGRGKVLTFTIIHRAFNPVFRDDIPFNYAIIELDEGPLIRGNIIGCRNEDIKVGMPVEVVFDDVTKNATIPRWKPK